MTVVHAVVHGQNAVVSAITRFMTVAAVSAAKPVATSSAPSAAVRPTPISVPVTAEIETDGPSVLVDTVKRLRKAS
jgi:mevalonate kinase